MLRTSLDVLVPRRLVPVTERGVRRRFVTDQQFLARNSEFDADVEEFTPPVVPVWGLDHDAATGDPVEEGAEFAGLRFNSGGHGVGRIHVSVGDLDR